VCVNSQRYGSALNDGAERGVTVVEEFEHEPRGDAGITPRLDRGRVAGSRLGVRYSLEYFSVRGCQGEAKGNAEARVLDGLGGGAAYRPDSIIE
jgi:hypothetical protein